MKVIAERDEPCSTCKRPIVYVTAELGGRRRPSRARPGPPVERHRGRQTMSDMVDRDCNWPLGEGPSADYGEG